MLQKRQLENSYIFQNWFNIKSEWQKNPEIYTLWNTFSCTITQSTNIFQFTYKIHLPYRFSTILPILWRYTKLHQWLRRHTNTASRKSRKLTRRLQNISRIAQACQKSTFETKYCEWSQIENQSEPQTPLQQISPESI